jgi:hypothetical protein
MVNESTDTAHDILARCLLGEHWEKFWTPYTAEDLARMAVYEIRYLRERLRAVGGLADDPRTEQGIDHSSCH